MGPRDWSGPTAGPSRRYPVGCQNYVMRSDLQCLDHVRVAVVPACLWLIGGGAEHRSVMSLQNASRRARCHRMGRCRSKAMTPFPAPTGEPVFRRCSGREVNGPCYQGIHTSGRRPCCVSRTRSGPEPPGYDRGTRTRRVRAALRWRGSRARTDTTHCPISAHPPQR